MELEFAKRLARVHALLDQAIVKVLTRHTLSRTEFDVLGGLRSAGYPYRLRPSELSGRLLLTTGGTSNILRRLENRHLVVRGPDPADGRGTAVQLTKPGLTLTLAAANDVTRTIEKFLADVPAETLQPLSTGLRDVLITLNDHVATDPYALPRPLTP